VVIAFRIMPSHDFTFQLIVSTLENEAQLGRVLFYPEISAFEQREDRIRSRLWELTAGLIGDLPLLELHRRHAAGTPELHEAIVELAPPGESPAWELPVRLRIHAVCWRHGEAAAIGYVPALDIEVVVGRWEDLHQQLIEQIRYALMRTRASTSLRELAWLNRFQLVKIQPEQWTIDIPTPKATAMGRQAVAPKSTLQDVATDLAKTGGGKVFRLDDTMHLLVDWLWGTAPRSVLLVGPSGVGKAAAVRKLAATRAGATIWSTSGARIVAGMCGFGMWQERCQAICDEAARTKAVIHLGNLVELMIVGQSVHNDQGVGDFLRSPIARGDFLAIAECTPEQLAMIERDKPNILEAFSRLDLREPTMEEGRLLLNEAAQAWRRSTLLDAAAIETLDRLHRRYATYSAYPGRPLRFLKNLLQDEPATPASRITAADVTATFSRETGLPLVLLEPSERLDLEATRRWFCERVVGQETAVQTVVDLLATVKAGLARPGRPIASLLFIGPTGVGKTEMAKALAEFLYQDRQRMMRIDMSEYADPLAADRLIGGPGGEGLLTCKIREQPFGVVLLDEFEKAHPRLLDLFLQVLGEGRLTDASGRLADFRNAVIIMTSNLGVESFGRQPPGFGRPDWSAAAQQHFVGEVQRFLRPEMFNRIDRVVTFSPLEKETLRQIARRELRLLDQREGIRYRALETRFGDSLVDEIVRQGYEPRYGARPIKRAIERHLLVPLAARLNECSAEAPLAAEIEAEGGEIRVAVRARRTDETMAGRDSGTRQGLADLAGQCVSLRRAVAERAGSRPVIELRTELFRLERTVQRLLKREIKGTPGMERELGDRLETLRKLVGRIDILYNDAVALEDPVLLACYGVRELDVERTQGDLHSRRDELKAFGLDLLRLQYDKPDYVTFVIYGEDNDWLLTLAQAYHTLFLDQGRVNAYELTSYNQPQPDKPGRIRLGDRESADPKLRKQANGTRLQAEVFEGIAFYSSEPQPALRGIALCLDSPLAWPRWGAESGVHQVRHESNKRVACLVHVSEMRIADYQPPEKADRKEGIGDQDVRRVYDRPRKAIEDRLSDQRRRWSGSPTECIAELVEERLARHVDEWYRS
jgi:ATP-dependent Clp protease ATP-binding subunit ClpC